MSDLSRLNRPVKAKGVVHHLVADVAKGMAEALYEAAALMVYPADRHQLTELVPAVNDPHWVFFSQLRIVKNWRLTEL